MQAHSITYNTVRQLVKLGLIDQAAEVLRLAEFKAQSFEDWQALERSVRLIPESVCVQYPVLACVLAHALVGIRDAKRTLEMTDAVLATLEIQDAAPALVFRAWALAFNTFRRMTCLFKFSRIFPMVKFAGLA
jgi:hypothetical protein